MVLWDTTHSTLDPNIHQNVPFLKIFSGGMPPNPPSKAYGFAMRKFPNRNKKNLAPPPKSWGHPCIHL